MVQICYDISRATLAAATSLSTFRGVNMSCLKKPLILNCAWGQSAPVVWSIPSQRRVQSWLLIIFPSPFSPFIRSPVRLKDSAAHTLPAEVAFPAMVRVLRFQFICSTDKRTALGVGWKIWTTSRAKNVPLLPSQGTLYACEWDSWCQPYFREANCLHNRGRGRMFY